MTLDYKGLKAAAIKMARAPRCVQRAVVESYCRAYCEALRPDLPKASGMFLLMRVLFAVHPKNDGESFGGWLPYRPPGSAAPPNNAGWSWPVYEQPLGHVLEIDRSRGTGFNFAYHALAEYDDYAAHFRMRTPAEIEALEIRGRP